MKYFKTYEGFKKDYMKKIDLKDFKKIKKGTKLMYMGGPVEVLDNNGYVLKLKGEDGRTFMVNKSQFDHGGMVGEESVVTEAAQIPSNIEKFAKERGVLRDVKQLARWAEKAGLGIRGGTAIGKGYDTLVLDLTYQGSEVYFDTYTGKIKVKGQPVNSWKTFSKAVNESSAKDGTEASDGKHKHSDHLEEDMEAMWQKAYGEKFSTRYPGVAKIIRQRKIRDPREIARIWKQTYGEDFKEEYPAIWDMLSK